MTFDIDLNIFVEKSRTTNKNQYLKMKQLLLAIRWTHCRKLPDFFDILFFQNRQNGVKNRGSMKKVSRLQKPVLLTKASRCQKWYFWERQSIVTTCFMGIVKLVYKKYFSRKRQVVFKNRCPLQRTLMWKPKKTYFGAKKNSVLFGVLGFLIGASLKTL